ncbi:MAG: hypothetical protein MUC87_13760 [Bacteroidia bacterium]|jgi:hypothetical protein|nr:hypothetical protein [Bacteroidia bacterium]
MKTDLELLSTLQRAEVSPFLWTRIQARIQAGAVARVKPALAWAALGAAMVVLAVNIAFVAVQPAQNESAGMPSTLNNLYNE